MKRFLKTTQVCIELVSEPIVSDRPLLFLPVYTDQPWKPQKVWQLKWEYLCIHVSCVELKVGRCSFCTYWGSGVPVFPSLCFEIGFAFDITFSVFVDLDDIDAHTKSKLFTNTFLESVWFVWSSDNSLRCSWRAQESFHAHVY